KDDSGEPSGEPSVNLEKAKKLNEKAKHRCVALCIETRPDVCIKYIDRLIEFGCTRVELGVQILSDKIYKEIKRGHVVQDVVEATKTLRNAGFKIGYHVMPGLPGSNAKKDLDSFKKLFSDERFKPDQLKIYPCQVMPGSELEKWYWQGKYKPYTKEETEKILVKMLKIIPRYCRVMRIMREIPPEYLVAGTTRIDLRKEIEEKLRKRDTQGCTPWRRENPKEGREPFQGLFEAPKNLFKIFTRGIKEIRFREVGFADKENLNPDLRLKITKYKSSGGQEYFLEIVNKDDILFGLLRLRISRNSAIIRELHVYGKALSLGERKSVASQHTGLGKQLMKRAEEITRDNGLDILRVISGVGVREYYRKLGYKLKEGYMVKNLKIF
ncbi:GNAT family N-acetyltransferase, partial [Candidatus Pacearchaeota archaeon]|nr:GNAT family N-acetyltransferase [Candidatus Pacearchaeota archaeon]